MELYYLMDKSPYFTLTICAGNSIVVIIYIISIVNIYYERKKQMIESITVLAGISKSGQGEAVPRIDMKMGDVVSIVGPTGSGKTTLINDIELFANENTPTRRRILINGGIPPEAFKHNPSQSHCPHHPAHHLFVRSACAGVPIHPCGDTKQGHG